MNIAHRLRKLEASGHVEYPECHTLIVEEHEIKEEVIRRHFGEEGPPEDALIILLYSSAPTARGPQAWASPGMNVMMPRWRRTDGARC